MVPQNTPPEMARNSWPPDFWEEHTGSMSFSSRPLGPLDNCVLSSLHSWSTVRFLNSSWWSQKTSLIFAPCWSEIARPINSSRFSNLKSSQETDGLCTGVFFFLPPSSTSESKTIKYIDYYNSTKEKILVILFLCLVIVSMKILCLMLKVLIQLTFGKF